MKYQIKITDKALKQYKSINKPFSVRIKEKIEYLSEKGLEAGNIKALTGAFNGLYRTRVNDYRIIFNIENELITIITILHRKDIYK